MGNQQLCCNYRDSNDPNAQNFGKSDMPREGASIKQTAKMKELNEALEKVRPKEKQIIKLQAVIRGMI